MDHQELSTEDKILLAASKIFTEKGYAGTKTRDIAEEAGINLALLNYYFRSKEKLFEQIMKVKVVLLFGQILPLFNNRNTTLEEKIDLVSEKYFEILAKNPNLPLFVISEIQKKTSEIKSVVPIKGLLKDSVIIEQIREKQPGLNPFHFLLNFLSMTIFPFVVKPVFSQFTIMTDVEFERFVAERKTLIPLWMKTMLNGPA